MNLLKKKARGKLTGRIGSNGCNLSPTLHARAVIDIIMKNNITQLINHARKLRDLFLDFIFPIECLKCGREGFWLCKKCFRELNFSKSQHCLLCGKENKFGEFCHGCKNNYNLDGVWIAGDYEDEVIANLIKKFKYSLIKDIGGYLGEFLILFLRDLINRNRIGLIDLDGGLDYRKFKQTIECSDILFNFSQNMIMPIPLHSRKKLWRGFNQAEILARIVADFFNSELFINKLIKIKKSKPQAKLNKLQRKINIKGCFAWRGNSLAGRNIILVDDVATTGSTLNECAKVLKENGAGKVWGLVVANG